MDPTPRLSYLTNPSKPNPEVKILNHSLIGDIKTSKLFWWFRLPVLLPSITRVRRLLLESELIYTRNIHHPSGRTLYNFKIPDESSKPNYMMCCVVPLKSSSNRSNSFSSLIRRQGRSDDDSPNSDNLQSPTFSLTSEYILATHTNSYNDIWSKIHPGDSSHETLNIGQQEVQKVQHLLSQVLDPSRDAVQEALQHAKPSSLIRLVSSYFDQSEKTSHLFLLLLDSVHQTRFIYRDLHDLFEVLPLQCDPDAFSQALCDQAFDVFLQFDSIGNPFTAPHSHNFQDMRHGFSRLNQQLHHRLGRSRFKVRLLHRPLLPAFIPSKITKKELEHLEQLDAAAKGTYVLYNDLDTIYCLSERLYIAIESDKFLVHLGLQRGRDRHPIHWVAKQLRKNRDNFLTLLMDLEEHVCLCFAAINRARSVLLEKIRPP